MEALIGKRLIFSAVYSGGCDPEFVCLVNAVIRDGDYAGQLFRDHVWVERGSWCYGLRPDDYISFSARVIAYETRTKGIYVSKTHGIRCRVIGKKHTKVGLKSICEVEKLL